MGLGANLVIISIYYIISQTRDYDWSSASSSSSSSLRLARMKKNAPEAAATVAATARPVATVEPFSEMLESVRKVSPAGAA